MEIPLPVAGADRIPGNPDTAAPGNSFVPAGKMQGKRRCPPTAKTGADGGGRAIGKLFAPLFPEAGEGEAAVGGREGSVLFVKL